ncbi:hypothetical protein [Paenibacillus xerothermodurans]|uniref:DUF4013 domain-containing protein n=1 Tax=Paenibacillus xerothermodurans TaxID=1977292 RepID=A0A2W1NAB0_PAEXE|nr:hypothetical protein [Paenibacillus xerothermodurans]PZE20111.1 hypothetical protein CBW46_014535 [Paenibacillus xerothermodurans]
MWKTMKIGWGLAWQQPFAVCMLFIYNLCWGVLLYRMVRSVVVPLLHRYPGDELSREAVQLFWAEAQFQLMKTDLIHPYVWWAVCLLLTRMIITPLLNAGVFYSLEHTGVNAGYRFVQGIRQYALAFAGLYALQTLLILAPLYLLVRRVTAAYAHQANLSSLAWDAAPLIAGYIVYVFVVQIMVMYMQFGKLKRLPAGKVLQVLCRNVLSVTLLAVGVFLVTACISAAVTGAAMLWAGFAAFLGLQAFRLVHMFLKMWAITTQYALWSTQID